MLGVRNLLDLKNEYSPMKKLNSSPNSEPSSSPDSAPSSSPSATKPSSRPSTQDLLVELMSGQDLLTKDLRARRQQNTSDASPGEKDSGRK